MLSKLGLAALALVWGSQFLVIKAGQESLPPLLTVAARYAVVLIVMQTLLWARPVSHPRRGAARLVYSSTQAISMGLMYWGTGRLPSSVAAIILGLTPFAVQLLAHFAVAGERIQRRALVATALGFAGLAVLTLSARRADGAAALSAAGIVAMLGVVAADAATKVSAKRLVAELPTQVLLRDMSLATLVFGLAAHAMFESGQPIAVSGRGIAAFLYLGLVASALASGLYLELLRTHTVGGMAYLQFMTTLVAVACGWWIADEQLPPGALAGAVLILTGMLYRVTRNGRAAG